MYELRDYQVTPLSGQRPEHVQTAFTTHLIPELLKVTRCYGPFSV
ncbi:hypothetical protein [Xenorhabdus szentirmaii]|nr:hypothetical protein [Xenorhabdus sp. 38]